MQNNKETKFLQTQKGKIIVACSIGVIVIAVIILIITLLGGDKLKKADIEKIKTKYVTELEKILEKQENYDNLDKAKAIVEKLDKAEFEKIIGKIEKYNESAKDDKKFSIGDKKEEKKEEVKNAFIQLNNEHLLKDNNSYNKDQFKDELNKIKENFKKLTDQANQLD